MAIFSELKIADFSELCVASLMMIYNLHKEQPEVVNISV